MYNILLADDHEIVLEGLVLMLSSVYPVAGIDCAKNADDIYAKMQKGKKKYHLLITDIDMPNMSIQELVKWVKICQPDCKIIVLSMLNEAIYAPSLYKAGIDGYINKIQSRNVLMNAINKVLSGNKYYSDKMIEHLFRSDKKAPELTPFQELSAREFEIMNFLVDGKSVSEICKLLNLRSSTVSTHKSRIFEKLNVSNVFELKQMSDLYRASFQ